jgi:hypothetical protein
MATKNPESWLETVQKKVRDFAKKHQLVLTLTDRQLSAAFEIGCFHALLKYYEGQEYELSPQNLTKDGEYRYLTTPSGNPHNFSYVSAVGNDGEFEIRQQVRVESHVNEDIRFTPDILVLRKGVEFHSSSEKDFAGGKRAFFKVSSSDVIAAHECKSMNPFPELMVAFIGMLVAAHEWATGKRGAVVPTKKQGHLAPTLFVGGSARALHLRMIKALQTSYTMNIVCGLHEGTWHLRDAQNRIQVVK